MMHAAAARGYLRHQLLFMLAVAFPCVNALAQAESQSQPAPPASDGRSLMDLMDVDHLLRANGLRQWLFLLGAIIVGTALGKVLSWAVSRISRRLTDRGWKAQAQVFSGLCRPGTLALFTLGLGVGLAQIKMSPWLGGFVTKLVMLLYMVAVFWYGFNLVGALETALLRITSRTATTLDDQLVPIIRKALRVFIVVVGSLFALQNVFERDIGAWLAGLGIAGLAVSLAAQDSLKNLFGSFTILFDRPFQPGHRIRYKGFDGTVVSLGFRSTRVRTLEGHLVTIPNSAIVNEAVENVGGRASIRRVLNITVTYDTPAARVEEAVDIVRELLASDEFRGPVHDPDTVANADPPRVFFDDFNTDSLNIKVYYWFRPGDWWAYLEYTQRLNLAIMRRFEAAGIEFAFPTRTLYLAGDKKRPLTVPMAPGDRP